MAVYMGEEEVIQKNMALAQEKVYTVEDIEALPEGVRAELIDGQMFYMATPSRKHQGAGHRDIRHAIRLFEPEQRKMRGISGPVFRISERGQPDLPGT